MYLQMSCGGGDSRGIIKLVERIHHDERKFVFETGGNPMNRKSLVVCFLSLLMSGFVMLLGTSAASASVQPDLYCGDYEIVKVTAHPQHGDIWADLLGAVVRIEKESDGVMFGSVIKVKPGSPYANLYRKPDSVSFDDCLFWMGVAEYEHAILPYAVLDGFVDGKQILVDYAGGPYQGVTFDGNYLVIWSNETEDQIPHIRGKDIMVLKRIN